MPRNAGVLSTTTSVFGPRSPRPFRTLFWCSVRPIPLRSCTTLSLGFMVSFSAFVEAYLTERPGPASACGSLRQLVCARCGLRLRANILVGFGTAPRDVAERLELLERFDRRVHDVELVAAPDALRQDVVHARSFDYRAHRTARDDARSRARRT